jgi:prepilin-type N-terminal cleavage/methylation domain-containing protein
MKNTGFTLIELMIIIVIILLITSIAIPNLLKTKERKNTVTSDTLNKETWMRHGTAVENVNGMIIIK